MQSIFNLYSREETQMRETDNTSAMLIVGLGAGGHAKVVMEILKAYPDCQVVGLLDPKHELHGQKVLGVPILGGDDELPRLRDQGVRYFFIGLGSTSDLKPRRRLYEFAQSSGLTPVSAIHPSAIISPSVTVGIGTTIMANAVINAGAQIGEDVIVNTGVIIEHDCVIGNHVHIATGASLAGGVWVGDNVHVGQGAVIRQATSIGTGAVIGAGAVLVADVSENQVMVGNPARPLAK